MTHAEQISHWGGLLAMFVLVHFPVDFIFQSHAEAMVKHNNARVRARHCAIYTLGFVPLLWYLGFRETTLAYALAILFFSHFVEDTYLPVVWWAKYMRRPPEMQWRVRWREGHLTLQPPASLMGDSLGAVTARNGGSVKRLKVLGFVQGPQDVRKGQRELDRIGFIEFVGEALGKILMITVDQIVHVCFLMPIVWLTPP